jgi:membrane protein YdbS with pleckstrin-like domain
MNYGSTLGMNPIIMSDKPSQWLNFGYLILTLVCFTFPPLGLVSLTYLIWRVLVIHFWRWDITMDSMLEVKGVLNVTTDEVQLFRIKDIRLYEPFFYRLVGLSKIYIITSDQYRPVFILDGIKDGRAKREMFKNMSLKHRKNQGVREVDFR